MLISFQVALDRVGVESSEDLIKGIPTVLGCSLLSKPTWMDTCMCSFTSVFLFLSLEAR